MNIPVLRVFLGLGLGFSWLLLTPRLLRDLKQVNESLVSGRSQERVSGLLRVWEWKKMSVNGASVSCGAFEWGSERNQKTMPRLGCWDVRLWRLCHLFQAPLPSVVLWLITLVILLCRWLLNLNFPGNYPSTVPSLLHTTSINPQLQCHRDWKAFFPLFPFFPSEQIGFCAAPLEEESVLKTGSDSSPVPIYL